MKIFKRTVKILSIIFSSLFVLFCGLVLYLYYAIEPTVWLVRWAFDQTTYSAHEDIEEIRTRVEITKDITYASAGRNNQFDIIISTESREAGEKLPTILWIHGGAFIAGDKSDVVDYMFVLADNGYVIINMNYGLGHENYYPTPLIQINELYRYLDDNLEYYPYLNLHNIVIGGDSAGAFIAAQFMLIQTNPSYRELTGINQVMEPEHIKGSLLFCGPYDFSMLINLLHNEHLRSSTGFLTDVLIPFFAQRIGEAYLRDKNWANNEKWEILTLKDYVTSDFPSVFITDANTMSFEEHGRALADQLTLLGVDVTTVFYETNLMHEYQFYLSTVHEDGTNYGMETLAEVLSYLERIFNE